MLIPLIARKNLVFYEKITRVLQSFRNKTQNKPSENVNLAKSELSIFVVPSNNSMALSSTQRQADGSAYDYLWKNKFSFLFLALINRII